MKPKPIDSPSKTPSTFPSKKQKNPEWKKKMQEKLEHNMKTMKISPQFETTTNKKTNENPWKVQSPKKS
jgi:hypothetical protein